MSNMWGTHKTEIHMPLALCDSTSYSMHHWALNQYIMDSIHKVRFLWFFALHQYTRSLRYKLMRSTDEIHTEFYFAPPPLMAKWGGQDWLTPLALPSMYITCVLTSWTQFHLMQRLRSGLPSQANYVMAWMLYLVYHGWHTSLVEL